MGLSHLGQHRLERRELLSVAGDSFLYTGNGNSNWRVPMRTLDFLSFEENQVLWMESSTTFTGILSKELGDYRTIKSRGLEDIRELYLGFIYECYLSLLKNHKTFNNRRLFTCHQYYTGHFAIYASVLLFLRNKLL